MVDEGFNNICLGKLAGSLQAGRDARDYPDQWKQWTDRSKTAVSFRAARPWRRKRRAYARILEIVKGDSALSARPSASCTHRSVMKALAAAFLRVPPPTAGSSTWTMPPYSIFDYDSSGFTLINWNNNSHLERNGDRGLLSAAQCGV